MKNIQKAYEDTVLTEEWRDFGPDDRKNRQMMSLLIKELIDALKKEDTILPKERTALIKKAEKFMK